MAWATVVLHGDLNDFPLSHRRGGVAHRQGDVVHRRFVGRPAVKDLLEALGIPHPEIAAITVSGAPAGFDHRLDDGARGGGWPAAEAAEWGLGGIRLTRDRGLLKRSVVRRGAYLRSDQPVEQLVEVALRFGPVDRWRPFGRCLRCNTLLVSVSREEVLPRLQPLTRIYYDDFRRCPGCGAIYWKGSHHARMERLVDRVRASIPRSAER